MGNWKKTLDVSGAWPDADYPTPEGLQGVAAAVAGFAQRLDEDEFNLLSEELTDAADEGDLPWFNAVWNAIYDYADYERIWVKTQ